MMDVDLTIDSILGRAETLFPDREIVTKRSDGSLHRYSYREMADRVRQLANALDDLGVEPGGRVGTVALNNYRHLELYFAPGCSGRSMHMCNMRLPDGHFQHTIADAGDEVLFVDPAFVGKVEANAAELDSVEQYVILDDSVPDTSLEPVTDYESLIGDQPAAYEWPEIDQEAEASLCHTSGTTGLPKGVPYSHRAIYLHSLMAGHTDTLAISESDVVLPVVPMFHANGWGNPYSATLVGAKQVLPGVHTDPEPIAKLIDSEGVTVSAAVPTVWLEMADYLDENPEVDISNIDRLAVGGSAPPESLIRRYDEAYDAPIIQGWGMTETTPLGTLSTLRKELTERPPDEQYAFRAKAGMPVPGIDVRVLGDDGDPVPRDGDAIGELQVRGPWVVDAYLDRPQETEASFSDDGWLRTGDIATWDEHGYIDVVDRTKDVIKSGGEWISSVELENELMAHDAVAEASVIAVDHEKWQERPMACVVLDEGTDVTADELDAHLSETFPKWWLPDRYEFLDGIPRTSTGKFDKMRLREQFGDVTLDGAKESA